MTVITDYLIIGGGAMGVAFADEIFTQLPKAKITIVDRRKNLGGHWNDAYDFVRLHQPSAYYGVNSLVLGEGNNELSSKMEILDYYKEIHQKLEKSGRVEFLFQHEYIGDYKVKSTQNPDAIIQFQVNKKLVDGTYMKVEIPATHAPRFGIDDNVRVVPINELIHQHNKWDNFCIIGNGKTGIDAILYLLDKGVKADTISWISPNDIWMFNRTHLRAGSVTKELLTHGTFIKSAQKADDIFLNMERKGGIMRLDKKIMPTKWKCATVNPSELKQLQKIKNIIRKGRVQKITQAEIQLQEGIVSYSGQTLFVNCTADGLAQREAKPIFSEGLIRLQSVLFCQQVFSAALIGKLEAMNLSDKARNRIKPVPHPEFKEDWSWIFYETIKNLLVFNTFSPLWLFKSRLNFLSHETPLNYLRYSLHAGLLFFPIKRAVNRLKQIENAQ